jgi:hypothetical protein
VTAPTCVVVVAGERFADTAAALDDDLEPTALADLTIEWGRSNTFDQPSPATCTFAVLDRRGGTLFTERLHVGDPLEVHAAGDIAQGTPIDVALDGGFEASPVGPAGNRVATAAPATAQIAAAPTAHGARAVQVSSPTARAVLRIPPAAFTPADPTGWDTIPRLGPNPWSWSVAVRPALHARAGVIGIGFASPQNTAPTGIVGVQTHYVWGDAAWHVVTDDVVASSAAVAWWLGLSVAVDLATWTAPYGPPPATPYAWTAAPGTWADYASTYADDVALMAPAGGTVRTVLAFAGRITDLTAQIVDPDGTIGVTVTAVDQLADLENRYVGEEPWLAEPFATRVGRITAAAGVTVPATIDPRLAPLTVTWRDVDHQPAAGLLAELAAGVDAVLWSATHATTGPYLWFEDVGDRTSGEVLEDVDGIVTIVVSSERPGGRTRIDGCQIPAEDLTWIRDVSDVITRVDATWKDQTVDQDGLPAPTDRAVRLTDAALEADGNVRRMGLSTPLISEAAALDVAARVLARTNSPAGRIDGLTWDLGLFPPAAGVDMAAALDLLDGTIRIGRGLIVDRADLWPDGGPIGVYLDGGTYTFDGAWTLGLVGSPLAGLGTSAAWNDLDPGWAWNEFDPAIEWIDLFGVAGPFTTRGGP